MAELPLLLSHPFECDYIPGLTAQYGYASLPAGLLHKSYSILIRHGFRRSGEHIFRPFCPACTRCQSVRIPVDKFSPNRSQRRNWKANHQLEVRATPAILRDEDFDLFQRYQQMRHTGGSMAQMTRDDYEQFLCSNWADTVFYQFRLEHRLLAVAVTDQVEDGLSAVYTFFDPAYSKQGLGDFAIQWQILRARNLGLPWVYLGYWIQECGKMQYKSRYQPQQLFYADAWHMADPEQQKAR